MRLFWPLPSGSNIYDAIVLGSCRKQTVQVQLSSVLAVYRASTTAAGGGSSVRAGCLQGDRQGDVPSALWRQLQECLWPPPMTSEEGHICASRAVKITLDQKDRTEI